MLLLIRVHKRVRVTSDVTCEGRVGGEESARALQFATTISGKLCRGADSTISPREITITKSPRYSSYVAGRRTVRPERARCSRIRKGKLAITIFRMHIRLLSRQIFYRSFLLITKTFPLLIINL